MINKSKLRKYVVGLIKENRFLTKEGEVNENDIEQKFDQYQNPQVIFHCSDGDYFLTNDESASVIYFGRTGIGDIFKVIGRYKTEFNVVPGTKGDGTEKIHRNFKDLCEKIKLDLGY